MRQRKSEPQNRGQEVVLSNGGHFSAADIGGRSEELPDTQLARELDGQGIFELPNI